MGLNIKYYPATKFNGREVRASVGYGTYRGAWERCKELSKEGKPWYVKEG